MKPFFTPFMFLFCFNIPLAWSNPQVGTLTQTQGTVKIFSHPSKTLQPNGANTKGTHVLYEGEYYLAADAKSGDKIDNGNIVRTAPGSKARVVFENGDQINVGSGTAYRVSWNEETPKTETQMNLMYGKVRGIIEKGGPRSRLKVKTRSAVMGVRGTDFFIAEGGNEGKTEISIIRGSVEVTPVTPPAPEKTEKDGKNEKSAPVQKAVAPKPIKINAGFSAEVGVNPIQEAIAAKTEKIVPKVELRKTTQEEFTGIQKSSVITPKVATQGSDRTPADETTQKEIEALEKKATTTTLKDIKTYDKKLYAVLEKQHEKEVSVDQLNQAAVQALSKEAPKAPAKRKPFQSELDDLEKGAYEKYFKNVD